MVIVKELLSIHHNSAIDKEIHFFHGIQYFNTITKIITGSIVSGNVRFLCNITICFSFTILGLEPRTLYVLGKHLPLELQPFFFSFLF
jgi:hypothetical protein